MKRLLLLFAILGILFAVFYVVFEYPLLFNKLTVDSYENSMATTAGTVIYKDLDERVIVLKTDADDGSVDEIRIDMSSEKGSELLESLQTGDFLEIKYLRTIMPSGGYVFMGLDDDVECGPSTELH